MSKKGYKIAPDNPAKSLNRYSKNPGRAPSKRRGDGHKGGRSGGKKSLDKTVGYILLAVQSAASVLMMMMLILLDRKSVV